MKLTDRQIAIVLLREWLTTSINPYYMTSEDIADLIDVTKVSEERRDRIMSHVEKIQRPFYDRVMHLYSNIKQLD